VNAQKLLVSLVILLAFCTSASAQNKDGIEEVFWKNTQFKWVEYIEYNNSSRYLTNGRLSNLSEGNFDKVKNFIKPYTVTGSNYELIKNIYMYMNNTSNFKPYAAGGSLIAKRTVDQIFTDGTLSGCHDWGLVLISIIRKFNIPAIFVDTAYVKWADDYLSNKSIPFQGHVFVEAFVDNKWILLNSTQNEYIENYDPMNPLIGFRLDFSNFYVMFKGIDPIDYGIKNNSDIQEAMKFGSKVISQDSKNYKANAIIKRFR